MDRDRPPAYAVSMAEDVVIRQAVEDDVPGLANLLRDVVDGGASVGFMHPLRREQALGYWQGVLAAADRGERLVLVAERDAQVVGTVQLLLTVPDNQPHRAELAKMQVHSRARRQGLGARLLRAAEDAALDRDRTLLLLDTVTGSDAERLYARMGWQRVGEVPDYALFPDGRPCSTTFFYRLLSKVGSTPRTSGPVR